MPTQRELLDAYNSLSSRLVKGTGDQIAAAFLALGAWRDEDFEKFLPIALASVRGAKLQASRLNVVFYQQMALLAGETFVAPQITAESLSTEVLRNGAKDRDVYRRPFVDVYRNLADGKDLAEATKAGALRISSIASTDVQLARRGAGFQARSNNSRIVGYARTLTGSENCALCYVASTQRYHKGDLLPIHPGCDCGEMPIFGKQDPGQIIDEIRLDATHQAIEDRFGSSAPNARDIDYRAISIREHGELGPMLTVADHEFTTESDI